MEITEIKVENWTPEDYSLESIYKHIARCARVCYQAKQIKEDESAYEYICRVLLRGQDMKAVKLPDLPKLHLSVLEHGTVYLVIPFSYHETSKYLHNPYSQVNTMNNNAYITTNMRVIVEESAFDDLQYLVKRPTAHTKRYTFDMITDIGCSRELNRHRTHSISEESTRYCRYTANKFGNHATGIKLPWISEEQYEDGYNTIDDWDILEHPNDNLTLLGVRDVTEWTPVDWYLYSIEFADLAYSKLIEAGWKAEQAREVLPLCTKTQVVHTAFVDDWDKFLSLRYYEDSGKCHPVMKEVATQINSYINGSR